MYYVSTYLALEPQEWDRSCCDRPWRSFLSSSGSTYPRFKFPDEEGTGEEVGEVELELEVEDEVVDEVEDEVTESAKKTFILSPSQNLDDLDEIPLFRKKKFEQQKNLSFSLSLLLWLFLTFSHLSLTLSLTSIWKRRKRRII